MNSLFRHEVLEAKRDTWLGRVQDVQPIPIKIIAIISFICVIIIILYTIFGGYTRRIHASGSIMPTEGLITIGSRTNGIVIEKNVIEGQFVHKGDKLFTISLENTSINGPTQQLTNNLLKKQKNILEKQLALKEKAAPIEKNNIKETLSNLYKQHDKVSQQIENDNQIIPLVQQSLLMIEKAKKMSLATNQEYQNQLYTYAQILGTHAQFLQNQTSIEGQILENASKYQLYDTNYQHDLNEIKKSINDIDQKIILGERNQTIFVTAPINGTITALRGYIGQQVSQDSALTSIVPEGQAIEAELYVPSSAVGLLKKNSNVILRYAAFPYQKFGLYNGTVTEITYTPVTSDIMGKDSNPNLKNEIIGPNSKIDRNFYRIRVKPEKNFIAAYPNKKYFLQPGMQVEADIAVDYRRLYQWMFQPIIEVNDTIKTRLTKPNS